jgi:hypothetical protein
MDAVLRDAGSLSFEFRVEAALLGRRIELGRGSLAFAGGNRMACELHGSMTAPGAIPFDARIVSDGRVVRSRAVGLPRIPDAPTPADLNDQMTGLVTHLGAAHLFVVTPGGGPPPADVRAAARLRRFEFGRRESGAQAVEFDFTVDDKELRAVLWIDVSTYLPVRRVVTAAESGEGAAVTEIYERFRLGGDAAAGAFDLPR